MSRRFALVLVLLSSVFLSHVALAQDSVELTILFDEDSLTVYVPGNQNVSLQGFGFEVAIGDSRYVYLLEDYEAFRSLYFSNTPTPICFRLERQGSQKPVPRACQSVALLTQLVSDADVFWYDFASKQTRTVLLISAPPSPIGICPAGQPQCVTTFTPPTAQPVTAVPPTPIVATATVVLSAVTATFDPDDGPVIEEFNGVLFVYVPEGCFMMGSDQLSEDERPVHRVCLSPYWIGQTEVTNAQYRACVDAGACSAPSNTTHFNDPAYADHPVVYVSWGDAVAYAEWLGGSLPTEAQWEYAARGPDGLIYPWGNDPPTCAMANIFDCEGGTTPVGIYPDGASWVGALDMVGNVWEWVADVYDADYYRRVGNGVQDPTGPGSGTYVGLRGASWDNDEPYFMPAASRIGDYRDSRYSVLGFRVVMPAN